MSRPSLPTPTTSRPVQSVRADSPQPLHALITAYPARRAVLKGGLGLSLLYTFGLFNVLPGCGDAPAGGEPLSVPPLRYDITFNPVSVSHVDQVVVPQGYTVEVICSAGDPVTPAAKGYRDAFQPASETEEQAGGNHDGMHYFELPGVDPQRGGLLVVNHEVPDYQILFPGGRYEAATATAEERRIALSAVGVSVIEIELAGGVWRRKKDSRYNKRYTGNTLYRVRGPAASVIGATVIGTLNNCSSGATPWGTYLTCEETLENDLDPSQPAPGYGWVVELDPQGELMAPTKRTAMGRFEHENVAFLTDRQNRVAFYMGDDGTPGCIYKFVPDRPYRPERRVDNADLLDVGTLYVARFNGDGSGEWRELIQGRNGLVAGAMDPGDLSQGPQTPQRIDFLTQADVLLNTRAAARVAGGTLMDRPEWITVGPDKTCYCTLTNNSGRKSVDNTNPRQGNRHGHIIKWRESEDSPLARSFSWEIVLLAGDPMLSSPAGNLTGDIRGDTFRVRMASAWIHRDVCGCRPT